MGKALQALILPVRDDIIKLNRYHITTTGGIYQGAENLLNPGSLEWVLEAIEYPLFGVQRYPTLAEKAALLAWQIIAGHVFNEGTSEQAYLR